MDMSEHSRNEGGAMSDDRYEVIVIRYGTRETMRSEVYLNYPLYGQPDGPIRMDYFVWVVRNAARTILVDTGYSAAGGERRKRTTVLPPLEAWARLGIHPEDAPEILLTHAHYDHTGHLGAFPGSRIRMARAELEFWTGPHAHRTQFHHSVEDDELAGLVAARNDGRIDFFDDEADIAPGVRMMRVGGHTPGQSVVLVQTVDGPVLLASDAIHYLEEYEADLPFMSVANLVDMYAGFDRIRALVTAGAVRHLVPGHDPGTLAMLTPYGAPLEGDAAVIGRLA
jgi:glyoxylase-like metal-dependent hydrolase (beta-lactamase superfamily II)